MDFKIQKKSHPKQNLKHTKDDIDIAYKFAKTIWKEFDRFCKAIVLFGSTTHKSHEARSDIDILVIVDDVSFYMSPEVVETYRLITEKTVAKVSNKLHITTLKFTSFWEYIRIGDPIGINMLRDGVALIDTGFFAPLQMLLYQGRIRPTKEAINAYSSRVPQTMHNSKWHIMQGTLDLYWAAIDAAHAALMKNGEMPQNPSKIAELIKTKLVQDKLVHKKCIKIMDTLYKTSKKILHREIKHISGKDYDVLQKDTDFFVGEMRKYLVKLT
jgi:predicted nucleotidyltransferase